MKRDRHFDIFCIVLRSVMYSILGILFLCSVSCLYPVKSALGILLKYYIWNPQDCGSVLWILIRFRVLRLKSRIAYLMFSKQLVCLFLAKSKERLQWVGNHSFNLVMPKHIPSVINRQLKNKIITKKVHADWCTVCCCSQVMYLQQGLVGRDKDVRMLCRLAQ